MLDGYNKAFTKAIGDILQAWMMSLIPGDEKDLEQQASFQRQESQGLGGCGGTPGRLLEGGLEDLRVMRRIHSGAGGELDARQLHLLHRSNNELKGF